MDKEKLRSSCVTDARKASPVAVVTICPVLQFTVQRNLLALSLNGMINSAWPVCLLLFAFVSVRIVTMALFCFMEMAEWILYVYIFLFINNARYYFEDIRENWLKRLLFFIGCVFRRCRVRAWERKPILLTHVSRSFTQPPKQMSL
jgi:hypothetical protein